MAQPGRKIRRERVEPLPNWRPIKEPERSPEVKPTRRRELVPAGGSSLVHQILTEDYARRPREIWE